MALSDTDKVLAELKRIEKKFDSRFDSVDKDLIDIKDRLRKIEKFVGTDNADFSPNISSLNGTKKTAPKPVASGRKVVSSRV